jgi:diketogulonate reductase-like aldo/keto reductase
MLPPPKIILNNGVEMPQAGLGTFLIPKEKLSRTIAMAYEMGYRQFDTAWRYYNEADIIKALKDNGIKREDVFITTKVNVDALYMWGYQYGKHRIFNIPRRTIKQAIELSFKNLCGGKNGYIDLFLVHFPWSMYLKMYECLTEMYHDGRIRAIGVCSFLPAHLESLKDVSDVVPAINQFEISPLNTQKKLIKYCQDRNIAVEAMSTFSHFRSNNPRLEILENEKLEAIASAKGKTVAQIVLRWLIQQGVIIIPKTWEEKHLAENISLFDFELSDQEMQTVDSLDMGKFLNYDPYHGLENAPKQYRNIQL